VGQVSDVTFTLDEIERAFDILSGPGKNFHVKRGDSPRSYLLDMSVPGVELPGRGYDVYWTEVDFGNGRVTSNAEYIHPHNGSSFGKASKEFPIDLVLELGHHVLTWLTRLEVVEEAERERVKREEELRARALRRIRG
jgi:hypothetical protein